MASAGEIAAKWCYGWSARRKARPDKGLRVALGGPCGAILRVLLEKRSKKYDYGVTEFQGRL
jgi:hypothetical protein